MAKFSWQSGEDFSSGGKYIREAGWYHVAIDSVQVPPLNRNGNAINNGLVKVHCKVLAGTVDGCRGKELEFVLFKPDQSHKDGGLLARAKVDRFLLACGLLKPNAKNQKFVFDDTLFPGCQFVVKIREEKPREGSTYTESMFGPDGKHFYHVDDPDVERIPRALDALKMIPLEKRQLDQDETVEVPALPEPPAAVEEEDEIPF